MFDKVQESLKRSKDERQKKRLEKERLRLEKAAAEAAREEERLQQEAQKIQTEKERLLSLDDKGLMVELILAMRGLYAQIEDIQFQQPRSSMTVRRYSSAYLTRRSKNSGPKLSLALSERMRTPILLVSL